MTQLGPTINLARISDDDLAQLRALALRSTMTVAPRLAEWLHNWCDVEQAARAADESTRTARHLVCLPEFGEYTDAELGMALQAASDLHFVMIGEPESVAEIIDRVLACACGEAGERLRDRGQEV